MPSGNVVTSLGPQYADKRRARKYTSRESEVVSSGDVFVANAAGTTTTLVGANAAPGTSDANVVRRGETCKLFNSSGVLKEPTVFRITTIAVGASTTVTITPAAAVATVSGDRLRLTGTHPQSENALDRRLIELGKTAAQLSRMTVNDKMNQLRALQDPTSGY